MDKPLFILNVTNPRSDMDIIYSLFANMPTVFGERAGDLDIKVRWSDGAAKCSIHAVNQPAEAQ
jgi:hypothetical protein